jgi:hypothetical protein
MKTTWYCWIIDGIIGTNDKAMTMTDDGHDHVMNDEDGRRTPRHTKFSARSAP